MAGKTAQVKGPCHANMDLSSDLQPQGKRLDAVVSVHLQHRTGETDSRLCSSQPSQTSELQVK